MALKIIKTQAEWTEYYETLKNASIYASWDYVSAAAFAEPLSAAELAVYESGDCFCFHPYLKRRLPNNYSGFDLTSPYDFGGFWFNTTNPQEIAACASSFFEAFEKYCLKHGIVSEFIRFNPFSSIPNNIGYEIAFVENNVVVDLTADSDTIWDNYRSSLKRNIKKAKSHGLKPVTNVGIHSFLELYYKNLDRLNSHESYYFQSSFLSNLPGIEIVGSVDETGALGAVQIYLKDKKTVYYYLGASNTEMLYKRPNDFLFNEMFYNFKKREFKTLHLGGGAASLLQYKRKFSSAAIPYYIGKKIFDMDYYNGLLMKTVQKLHKEYDKEAFDQMDFFPKYRATVWMSKDDGG